LTFLYIIPLEIILAARVLRLTYSFTLMQIAIGSMLSYSPINHCIILLFVRHFRRETSKLIKRLTKRNTRTLVVHKKVHVIEINLL
jgi:hypothetical protein